MPTPGCKGRTFKLCVLTRWDFNFCVRSSPLRGSGDGGGNGGGGGGGGGDVYVCVCVCCRFS